MAKLIYSMKMVLLSEKIIAELPKGSVFCVDQLAKLQRFVKFVVLVYIPWWITCSQSSDAPVNDLKLLKMIHGHDDKVMSRSAATAFSRHYWYLSEELVPLALFSDKLLDQEKQSIIETLLSFTRSEDENIFENRTGSAFGKPSFPTAIDSSHSLSKLVGPDSWGFLEGSG